MLPWAGSLVALALLCYLVPAGRTLAAAFARARLEAAIARALPITLTSLFVSALIGVALAWAIAGRGPASLLSYGPPIHASFAHWLADGAYHGRIHANGAADNRCTSAVSVGTDRSRGFGDQRHGWDRRWVGAQRTDR